LTLSIEGVKHPKSDSSTIRRQLTQGHQLAFLSSEAV